MEAAFPLGAQATGYTTPTTTTTTTTATAIAATTSRHLQQYPQHSQLAVGHFFKKSEVPREKLTDYEFDKIVVETSARLAARSQHSMGFAMVASSSPAVPNHPPPGQPKRPMNAFMVWGQAIRRELHTRFSNVQNALLSKALGRVWKQLDLEAKEPYISRANIIKTNHKRDFPDYRYQPRRIQEKQRRIQANDGVKQQQQQAYNQRANSNNNSQKLGPVLPPTMTSFGSTSSSLASISPPLAATDCQLYYHNGGHSMQEHVSCGSGPYQADNKIITHQGAPCGNQIGVVAAANPSVVHQNDHHHDHNPHDAMHIRAHKSCQYAAHTTTSNTGANQHEQRDSAAAAAMCALYQPVAREEAMHNTIAIYGPPINSHSYSSSSSCSETSNDNQYGYDHAGVAAGAPLNQTTCHQSDVKQFLQTTAAGQTNNFDCVQPQCQLQVCDESPMHKLPEHQDHCQQLLENHDMNRHEQYPTRAIAGGGSQGNNAHNSLEYQFYRQPQARGNQHQQIQQQQQQQQQQQPIDFEDSSQYSARGGGIFTPQEDHQVTYAPSVDTRPAHGCMRTDGPQQITQQTTVDETNTIYPQGQADFQAPGGTYHLYRSYSNELSLI